MRYWDASAILPLLYREEQSAAMLGLLGDGSEIVTWWGSEVECTSALARIERDMERDSAALDEAFLRLDDLASCWHELQPATRVKDTARRLLRVHPLRAADALQLASALVASDFQRARLSFVCLDLSLATAARKEGFEVIGA